MEQRVREKYTADDMEKIPEDKRVELIDGELYDMASPSGTHQEIASFLIGEIYYYIKHNHGDCKVFGAPYAVYLNEYNYFEPDISVICDKSKLDNKGCHGAPDWIIEIISPGTCRMDYITKFYKYAENGVRLYWIVNPAIKRIVVWFFERGYSIEYSFGEEVQVDIYQDLSITIPKDIGWEE